MISEILPNLYTIEVPLPQNPLRAVNSYVIKAQGRSLIIDTGMNREECMNVLSPALMELGVDLKRADFFITHLHADHLGLVSNLATDTSKIYFGRADAAPFSSAGSSGWERQSNFARTSGFPENELQGAIRSHPGYKYSPRGQLNFSILNEGDTLSVGGYLFESIETPGHTKGHMCLYEAKKGLFVSGDHILIDITPNISLWSDDEDPLKEYLASLDKVYDLDVELVLPGHRSTFSNFRERIEQLKHHHETRANEVLSILGAGSQNAYQVASQMSWDLDYKAWEQFPVSQKWFATGEAVAHLKYLEEKGRVGRELQGQRIAFSVK